MGGKFLLNFTAIDFETATRYKNSACSVAVVDIEDGKIVDKYYTLIRPPRMEFDSCNIMIHHITPDMVEDAEDFSGIWPELEKHLSGRVVLAHNAPFDMGVLRSCLLTHKIDAPEFIQGCTVQLSRKAWPELMNHKLDTVGRFLNVDFKHHDALEDARACAAIPLAAAKAVGASDINELFSAFNVKLAEFDPNPHVSWQKRRP